MRIFSSPKQSPRHSKNCLWKSAPHKRGSWSVVTLSHLKSCIHCFLHICLNIQMQIYALHSLKNLSYFWILQPRVDFTHIQNVLEYQSLIIDMHWKKVTILMWNRDGFGPKFSGPRPIWAAPAQPKLVGPRAGPNPNLFPYRWVWAKIFRPGPAQIGWALGWARPKPIPIWGLHYIRWFFLS